MNGTIKFKHAEDGTISVNYGVTCLVDVLAVGALTNTVRHTFPYKNMVLNEYQTDEAGLVFLRDRTNQIIEFINDSVVAVSTLLAANEGVVFDDQGKTITELISGLIELSNVLSGENQEVNHALLIGKNMEIKS